MCSSPKLFAAYHVLRRPPMPRHPSCALSSLTTKKHTLNDVYLSLNISCLLFQFSLKKLFLAEFSSRHFSVIVKQPRDHLPPLPVLPVNPLSRRPRPFGILVGVLGFEPRTSSLSGTRSNQLSYTPWWSRRGSNPRHPACKAGALAN